MNESEAIRIVLDEIPNDSPSKLNKYQDEVWYDILKFQSSVNNVLRLMDKYDIGIDDLRAGGSYLSPLVGEALFECWPTRVCTVNYVVEKLITLLNDGDYRAIIKTARWEDD